MFFHKNCLLSRFYLRKTTQNLNIKLDFRLEILVDFNENKKGIVESMKLEKKSQLMVIA